MKAQRREFALRVLLTAALLGAVACEAKSPSEPGPTVGSVHLLVADRDGAGVPGAEVTLRRGTITLVARSAANGSLVFPDLEEGEWTLEVAAPEKYALAVDEVRERRVRVASGAATVLTVRVHLVMGSIEGQVQDTWAGMGVAGLSVYVSGVEGPAMTDAQGRYTFPAVPAGSHTVRLELPAGFLTRPADVKAIVEPGRSTRVNWFVQQTSVSEVAVRAFEFVPESIEVAAGTAVRWTNHDSVVHSVVGVGMPYAIPELRPGQAAVIRAQQPGIIEYRCTFHESMRGTIVVR